MKRSVVVLGILVSALVAGRSWAQCGMMGSHQGHESGHAGACGCAEGGKCSLLNDPQTGKKVVGKLMEDPKNRQWLTEVILSNPQMVEEIKQNLSSANPKISAEQNQGDTKVADPVCGMRIDPRNATATSNYRGKTYYFCSAEDRDKFDRSPDKYIPTE